MSSAKKVLSTSGWKPNKEFENVLKNHDSVNEIVNFINSPKFTEKDYIDTLSGLYGDLSPHGYSSYAW